MSMTLSLKPQSDDNAAMILKRNINAVMQKWEECVRREVPAARQADRVPLLNSLPDFLDRVVAVISTTEETMGGERFSEEVLEPAREHGQRCALDPHYTLDQIIHEYRILRRTTLEVLEQKLSLTHREREKLLEAIDHGLVQAATEFASRRGFQAARLSEAEAQVRNVRGELKKVRNKVDELQIERALRERFVSTLTHDLRTPLTAMKASAELIVKQAEKSDLVRRLAVRICDGTHRIDRMIRDLLDANRIEAGEPVSLKIEECDLVLLTQELIESLATVYGDRFSLEVRGELKGFWSPSDFQRVIENLVLNGIKYGDPIEKVGVSLRGLQNHVTIAVHNRGKPIPPEQQEILFEPFKRSLSAQMGGKGGWGLGLTLVKGIVKAHGGKIDVDSRLGYGTIFTLSLPRDSRLFQGSQSA